jgi:uncharacterized protein (TIGR02646 family)
MRKLDRTKVTAPSSLSTPSAGVATEKAAAVGYYGARTPWQASHVSYKFTKYRSDDVKGALYTLSGGKCAYCESKIFGDGSREVEHYRPKGGIDGIVHPGYWWLAHDWENLLPTCPACNKSRRQYVVDSSMSVAEVQELMSKRGKDLYGTGTQFLILGTRAVGSTCILTAEDPLLIDPCIRDPKAELCWDFSTDLPLVQPATSVGGPSVYGAYTINTCGLNRAGLVLARISALKILKYKKDLIIDRMNNWTGSAEGLEVIIDDVKSLAHHLEVDQPFLGMVNAYIEDFENELELWRVARGLPPF